MPMFNSSHQLLQSPQQMMQIPTSPQYMYNQGGTPASSNQQAWSQVQSPNDGTIHGRQMQNIQAMACRADVMTIEQTAFWVRTLGHINRWPEAEEYENIFRDNGIKGYLLQSLTNESLKSDLGISKHGHRMELMTAIKSLFPKMGKSSVRNSPMPNPVVKSSVGYENGNSVAGTYYSPLLTFGSPTMTTPQCGPQHAIAYPSSGGIILDGNAPQPGGMSNPTNLQNGPQSAGNYNASQQYGPQSATMGCPANLGSNGLQ